MDFSRFDIMGVVLLTGTTGAARIPAWGQEYLNHQKAFRCWKFQVTKFRMVAEW
jgi:hypothetical protein